MRQWLIGWVFLTAFLGDVASAEQDNWYPSRYGANDSLGAINNLSAGKVLQAARLVKTGKTYALGVPTGPETPTYPPRKYSMTVLQLGDGTGQTVGSNHVVSNDDLLITWMGIGSQIDGLGHAGIDHRYYNGVPAGEFVRPSGLTRFSVHSLPPIVTRGVLLDMARHLGQDVLKPGTAINRAEIEAAAKAQGIAIEQGDVVLLHTGWLNVADSDPQGFMKGEPGLGLEGARYLASLGVVAIGADNWALEAVPSEEPGVFFPVHPELLAKNGTYILESMDTRALAADRVYEFLFVLGQPRFVGSVQTIVNPVAIR